MNVLRRNRRYLIAFLILFILCWMFPYTGDDWAWGSSVGLERLSNHFAGYNGRYFGNLIVLALTRSNCLKAAVMAFCLTGILGCIQYMARKSWSFYAGALLLLFLPRQILQQAVVWTSGFSNYAVSVFMTLLYCCSFYRIFDEAETGSPERASCSSASLSLSLSLHEQVVNNHSNSTHGTLTSRLRKTRCLLLFPLGFCGALIMETISLYNLILSVFVVGYLWFRRRTAPIEHLCYLAGTALGTFLMFSNSSYAEIANGTGYYRTVPHSVKEYLLRALDNYFEVLYRQFYRNNLALNLAILIVMALLYYYLFRSTREKANCVSIVMFVSLLISCVYWAYSFVSVTASADKPSASGFDWFEGLFTLIAGCSMIVFCVMAGILSGKPRKILFLICSIAVMTAPLLFVTPIGPRNFFPSYIFFILLFLALADLLPPITAVKTQKRLVSGIAGAVMTGVLLCYFSVFSQIYAVTMERIDHTTEEIASGAEIVAILEYPYRDLLWNSTPNEDSNLAERYKRFYDLPLEVTLIPVEQYSE